MGVHVSARKRLFRASYSFGRAPAQSSATLTGEYRTPASELLKPIHLETMSAFIPRETSIRMSESTRTVIVCEAGLAGHFGEDFEHSPPRRGGWSGPCESPRIPALLSSAHPACRG